MTTIILAIMLGIVASIGFLLSFNDHSVLGVCSSIAVLVVSVFIIDGVLATHHKTIEYHPIVTIERNQDQKNYVYTDNNIKVPLDKILSTFNDELIKDHLCIKSVIVTGKFATITNSSIAPISAREK